MPIIIIFMGARESKSKSDKSEKKAIKNIVKASIAGSNFVSSYAGSSLDIDDSTADKVAKGSAFATKKVFGSMFGGEKNERNKLNTKFGQGKIKATEYSGSNSKDKKKGYHNEYSYLH